jgi:hypothetical protein
VGEEGLGAACSLSPPICFTSYWPLWCSQNIAGLVPRALRESLHGKASPFRFSSKSPEEDAYTIHTSSILLMKTFTRKFLTHILAIVLLMPFTAQCYYNASTGRWLSRDPVQEAGGLSLYGFCVNNGVCRWDFLGLKRSAGPLPLCSYCCECAEDISITKVVKYEPSPWNGNPASYFEVSILISHKLAPMPRNPQAPKFEWNETSNLPTAGWAAKGQKPNAEADLHALDPLQIPNQWKSRDKSCDSAFVTVLRGDEPTADPSRGPRYIKFRLRVVNPSECKCPLDVVEVTALQTYDPTKDPPMDFETPSPR